MSCSSSTICSHLSLPSCSSSSSRSSNFYRDVKTMFIARHNTLPHHQDHQLRHPPRKTPIWTVAYSSSTIDPCGPYYADPETLESHRNHPNVCLLLHHHPLIVYYSSFHINITYLFQFSLESKRNPSNLQCSVPESNAKRKALFLFIIPFLFILALLAVYHVIHMQKGNY